MTNLVAQLKVMPDGDIYMNDVCTALMFGVSVESLTFQIEKHGRGSMALTPLMQQSGVRRRKHYEAVIGSDEIDILGLLSYYARLEGVGLIYDNGEGVVRTLVASPS